MKNSYIKAQMQFHGIEWSELADCLHVPLKDLVRRLNGKEATPQFRRNLMRAITTLSQRPEILNFYDDSGT